MFRELTTQRLFFLQVKRDIGAARLRADKHVTIQLCALALQAQGDFVSAAATKHHIEREKLIPDHTISEFSHSLEQVVEAVNAAYRTLAGTSEASAILGYMTIAQQLRGYGVHHYAVTSEADKLPYYLGIGPSGVSLYDQTDLSTPRRSWQWLALENVSWKKLRFELELDEGSDETSVHIWKTQSAYQSEQMLKMVLFQHSSSLAYERAKAARRLGATDPRVEALSKGKGGVANAPESPHAAPAAKEVRLPSDATHVHRLVSVSATNAVVSPSVRTFASSPSGGFSDKSDLSTLHRLERRRDQLKSELKWHRELLAQCTAELEVHMPSIRTAIGAKFRQIAHEAGQKSAVATVFQKGVADAARRLSNPNDMEGAKPKSYAHKHPLHPSGLVHVKEHTRTPHAPTGSRTRRDTPMPSDDPAQRHREHDSAASALLARQKQHLAAVHATGRVNTKVIHPPPPGALARQRRGTPMPGTLAATAVAATRQLDQDDSPLAPAPPHAVEGTPPGWFLQSKRREAAEVAPASPVINGRPKLESLSESSPSNGSTALHGRADRRSSAERHASMSNPTSKAWV